MSEAVVGKWGKNLAVRVPQTVARACGLSEGEPVDVVAQDGDIVIRRAHARSRARAEAEKAAREIVAESARHSLGGVSIRELLEEGRRG